MARLDGMSKELYPGERAAAIERQAKIERLLNLRHSRPPSKHNFRIFEARDVERHSTGFKITYKSRGAFRG